MPHNVFDDDSVRKIAADHERLKNQVRNLASTVSSLRKAGDTPGDWGRLLRTGITCTNDQYPNYPADGNTFVVGLEAWTFEEVPGDQDVSYRRWCNYVIAHTEDNEYLEEGTRVIIYKQQGDETHGRRYWIRPVVDPDATTTTTSEPVRCTGTCKWTWNGSYWAPSSVGCGTTSTTTANPNTSTTSHPCVLANSRTTTTTANPATCQCEYPSFCGNVTNQCTYTSCIQGTQTVTVSCTSTTTSTTTTTCDCNTTTTTTGDPDCTGSGCSWLGVLNSSGGYQWIKTSDDCGSQCPCATPTGTPSDCSTTTSSCVTTTTTTTTAQPCTGRCIWHCNNAASAWVFVSSDCHGWLDCNCTTPTIPCNSCNPTSTPCTSNTTTTTTTRAPCWQCYTTTTSSTTTTTTTSSPCANGQCVYTGASGSWVKISDTCHTSCACDTPGSSVADSACQLVATPCQGTTTTTTTSTTTTTTCAPTNCTLQCVSNVYTVVGAPCCSGYCQTSWGAVQGNFCSPDSSPFAGTCGTTTTTTTTAVPTSTTTAAPCNNRCWMQCVGGVWTIVGSPCDASCPCVVSYGQEGTSCSGFPPTTWFPGTCNGVTTTTAPPPPPPP